MQTLCAEFDVGAWTADSRYYRHRPLLLLAQPAILARPEIDSRASNIILGSLSALQYMRCVGKVTSFPSTCSVMC